MKCNQYFLFILISVISILNINGKIPCSHTGLHVNGRSVDQAYIVISDDTRFIVGISSDEYLHLWDLFHGSNAIIKLDIAFDQQNSIVNDIIISDMLDDGTILIGLDITSHEDDDTQLKTIKIIKYNCTTKEIYPDFYKHQSTDDRLCSIIQGYKLITITTQGIMRKINLITKREETTNLFENIPSAIGYNIHFCKYENSIIIANKYEDTSEPHAVSFWYNNNLIARIDIPKEYIFESVFSDGSFLLRHESNHSAKIYNVHSKISYTMLYSIDIEILHCEVFNDSIASILYKQENRIFLRLINSQTKEYISFELPNSSELVGGCITDDNNVLKIILFDKATGRTSVLDIGLFSAFKYLKNREMAPTKPMEMLTGDYKITYNSGTDIFEINRA